MKTILSILILSITQLISVNSFSQDVINASQLTENWQLINEQDGVQIFIKSQNCDLYEGKLPYEFSFLKIVNNTNSEKSITYNYIHQFNEGCDGCNNSPERTFTKIIAANSSLEEDCSFKLGSGFSSSIKNHNFDGGWTFLSAEIKITQVK